VNKIRNLLLPALMLMIVFVGFVAVELSRPMGVAHAQGSPADQSSGWAGTALMNPSNATVISATTTDKAIGGGAVISGAGVNARIHLKYVQGMATTSCTVGLYEHPTSGSNKFICNLDLAAATPNTITAGQNQGLGLNGYLTAAGSSIVMVNSVNSNVTALHFTYTLE
jgi:hypothetical protein